jgi:YHS domain-containing protein
MKKLILVILAALFLGSSFLVWAVEDVGNKFCPVSGEKIEPGEDVKYEYEGKIYHFCCPACIEAFRKEPQNYIKKIEEGKAEAKDVAKKSKMMGSEKMAMHKEMCNNLKALAEIVGSLKEVKNNPELKQKIDEIIAEVEEMKSQCPMMQKHEEEKEHKGEHEHHHGMMQH